jgi:hypothetical protein
MVTNRQHVAAPDHSSDLVVVGRHSTDEQAGRRAESAVADRSRITPVDTRWSFSAIPPHAALAPTAAPSVAARFDDDGHPLPPAAAALAPTPEAAGARIHTGPAAADLTQRAGAEAVTVGHDIAFAPGRFDPHSGAGRRRLAHELTHVAQQSEHPGNPVVHRDGDKPVSAPTTLAGLPEKERKQLQVVSTLPIEANASGQLKGAFEASTITAKGVEAVTDSSVPEEVAQGLKNLAGDWASGKKPTLKPNQTVTVDLDLTPHKGKRGLYRFTYTPAPPAKKKGETTTARILIEQVSPTPATAAAKGAVGGASGTSEQTSKPAKDPVDTKIKDAALDISGYSKKHEAALREAIAKVPASHLAIVKGLKFRRDTTHKPDPKVAGHYNEETHTVVMFDKAFVDTQVVFDEAGAATSYAAKQIIHEIGHAVDLAPLRAAWATSKKAREEMNAKAGDFTSKEEADAFKKAKKASDAADKALTKARSRSGTKPVTKGTTTLYEIGKAHKGVEFREAVKADGKDVSKYAEKDWQESYAEAYALYLAQPALLKRIRPKIYDHLSKTLPK